MTNWLQSQFSLTGKTALVTGASKGIGASIAIAMAQAGADVVLVGRSQDSLLNTRTAIENLGRTTETLIADVESRDQIAAAFKSIEQLNVEIVVNNAGSISRAPAIETSLEDWDRIIDTNLNSVFQISQLCAKSMLVRGHGRIINIASLLSFQGGINVPAYTASKHAVAGVTKALANEWGAKGVTVNAIAPGYVSTDNTQALRNDVDRNTSILARIPIGRWGTPEDLAAVAVFLASPAAAYINGEIITVDGGWMGR
ncbi:MAG: 2-deoxy-D-gluconate 3-dehydrogenase [Actinomycetota bacterium]|jgi:2-deoxy-D-gluconate 3-dehydrogenase